LQAVVPEWEGSLEWAELLESLNLQWVGLQVLEYQDANLPE
jgi:hypothetical protein